MESPWGDEIISRYTAKDSVRDGIAIELAPGVYCTTNLARRIAPADTATGIDYFKLALKLLQLVKRWRDRDYFDAAATKHPEDTDWRFAIYKVGREKVWLIVDGEGLHFILPEDH